MTSELEETLAILIRAEGLPEPVREYRFHPVRRFRFDFAWPDLQVAVECEGGTWTKSRHTSGRGYQVDCIKYNLAALSGWLVLRFTRDMIEDGTAIEMIKQTMM